MIWCRAEFDIQARSCNAREKLTALEARVTRLEAAAQSTRIEFRSPLSSPYFSDPMSACHHPWPWTGRAFRADRCRGRFQRLATRRWSDCPIPRSRKRGIGCAALLALRFRVPGAAHHDQSGWRTPQGIGRFDLPIALGILAASNRPVTALDGQGCRAFLSGTLRPIRGALAMVLAAEPSRTLADPCKPVRRKPFWRRVSRS